MKKREIKNVIDGLKKVKIAKLEDKALRTVVFKVFMKLLGEQRKFEEKFEDLKTVFLSTHKEEQGKVASLQQQLDIETDRVKAAEIAREINSHKDYRDALKALNEKIEALGNEEIKIESIDMDKFMEEYQKQDMELSTIEEIYPLFNIKSK